MLKNAAKILLTFLLTVFFQFGSAQINPNVQIRLNYLTTNDGLPQNTVDCILKDKEGFMWFGTWNGLCRYDGYNFKIYNKEQEGTALKSNFIQSVCEDDAGNLWVGTDKGLAYFDYCNLSFVEVSSIQNDLGKFNITHLIKDSKNTIYAATSGHGIWKIGLAADGEVTTTQIGGSNIPSQDVRYLCIANDDHLLAGTSNGLAVINLEGNSSDPALETLQQQLNGIDISVIFQDSKENIWIGTGAVGLYLFKPVSGELNYFAANDDINTSLDHMVVYAIIEDLNGQIIIGTLGGLNYYNPSVNNFSHFPTSTETHKYLNNPFVNALFADDLGNIWICTEKGGVNYYNTYQKPFFAIKNEPANANSISHNTINAICKEGNTIWIGTAGGGLNKLSGIRNRVFMNDPLNSSSIPTNFVSAILRDNEKNFWVGTWGGGLNLMLDENRNNFRAYQNDPANPQTICSSFIASLDVLDKNHVLVGSRGGLDVFNPAENAFTHVHDAMNLQQAFEVGCALVDSKDRVWVGTETGLYRFDKNDLLGLMPDDESIDYEIFLNDPNDLNSLPGDYIISIFEAKDGTVWFGTYGNGLCKYAEENGKVSFVCYNSKQGLCNNVTYAIEEDGNGNLWISTDKGLAKFNPQDESFQNFYENDGLLSDQFYWAASWADKDGTLYFGGVEGLNYFSPEQIEPYPNTPLPVFTEFSIFNKAVEVGEKFHSKVVLEKPVSETDRIQLSYKDAVFSIEFSALDYFLPQKIQYKYKMEGVDQDWVEVDANRRFANYTNLSGGEYTFMVKASNSDGVWSDETTELQIVVKPPFWETRWFQILAVLFIVFLVMMYISSRTRFLHEQKRKLEIQVQERTKQIEEQKVKLEMQAEHLQKTNHQLEERQVLIEGQKVELEKQNEQIASQRDEVIELNKKVNLVNQLRLRFFTNISHEFRTPLTLIIDPLEQLLERYKSEKNTTNTLNIINRNAQRLLHLINQLIYFRKIETGKLQLNVSKGNLVQYLNEVFHSFSDLADNQGIHYEFVGDQSEKETWFDSEKIENVFYNLLSNAFKFTPESGSISLKVKFVDEPGECVLPRPLVAISVIDSGSGISEEHISHIFDRFYKAEQSRKDTDFTSSGIGLALTYEIVQALHGDIKVHSKPGEGSTFTVYLPYTKDRFEAEEINENAVPTAINIEGRVQVLSDHIVARDSGYDNESEIEDDRTKPTVLIVEDNFDLRSFLLQTLRSEYRVLGAENGKIGLEMAKKYTPELIISDVMMPVMDGMELCSRLKKNIQTSHIPIILLTAKNMVESMIEGLETGADDYIPKPFNLEILQVRMRNMIESRRKIKKLFSSPDEETPVNVSNNSMDEEFLKKVYSILESNFDREDFSIDHLAREMFVSRSLLYKKIKALTDLNVTDFINSFKLKKAVSIIRTSNKPISEVAFSVGFNDPKYFSRIFKKFYGSSPSEFARKDAID